jgi:N4-gp56 family major capsid protein
VVNAFQYAFMRTGTGNGENPLTTGALGDLLGIRFYETTNATTLSGLGQSARDIWETLFIGREAYAVIELNADTARTYFKPRGSSGVTDPLDQVWSLGWKAAFTAVRLDENRILRYESAATVS